MKTKTLLTALVLYLFLGVFTVKADELPFELKAPPDGTKLWVISRGITFEEDEEGYHIEHKIYGEELELEGTDTTPPKLVLYNSDEKLYYYYHDYVFDKETEIIYPSLPYKSDTLENALSKSIDSSSLTLVAPSSKTVYYLLYEDDKLKYSLNSLDVTKYMLDRSNVLLDERKAYVNETNNSVDIKLDRIQSDLNDCVRLKLSYKIKEGYSYHNLNYRVTDGSGERVLIARGNENKKPNSGYFEFDLFNAKNGTYIIHLTSPVRSLNKTVEYKIADIPEKKELPMDTPVIKLSNLPKNPIKGKTYRIKITTQIPTKIRINQIKEYNTYSTVHEIDITEDTHIIEASSEYGIVTFAYPKLEFKDAPSLVKKPETKAEDKPLVVSDEVSLAQTGKERPNYIYLIVPSIILILFGVFYIRRKKNV